MFDSLISMFAPHYCLSCGEIGAQICDNCFFDIELAPLGQCVLCKGLLSGLKCSSCSDLLGVSQIVLSERDGVLKKLVDDYKFMYTRASYKQIARCLDTGAPLFPATTQLVPIPTTSTHTRMRSFDHTRDFTRELAKRRGLQYAPLLSRRHNKSQVGASAKERKKQAQEAFMSKTISDTEVLYVVCDDITTTGSTLTAAAVELREAGAEHIAILALLRQHWS